MRIVVPRRIFHVIGDDSGYSAAARVFCIQVVIGGAAFLLHRSANSLLAARIVHNRMVCSVVRQSGKFNLGVFRSAAVVPMAVRNLISVRAYDDLTDAACLLIHLEMIAGHPHALRAAEVLGSVCGWNSCNLDLRISVRRNCEGQHKEYTNNKDIFHRFLHLDLDSLKSSAESSYPSIDLVQNLTHPKYHSPPKRWLRPPL